MRSNSIITTNNAKINNLTLLLCFISLYCATVLVNLDSRKELEVAPEFLVHFWRWDEKSVLLPPETFSILSSTALPNRVLHNKLWDLGTISHKCFPTHLDKWCLAEMFGWLYNTTLILRRIKKSIPVGGTDLVCAPWLGRMLCSNRQQCTTQLCPAQ